MPIHILNTQDTPQTDTPVNCDRFKHFDPNRQPNTNIQPKADEKRKNMMKDSRDTTILMRLSQYQNDVLWNTASDFDDVYSQAKVDEVWRMFREALGMPTEIGKRVPANLKLTEKDYSAAWVRI